MAQAIQFVTTNDLSNATAWSPIPTSVSYSSGIYCASGESPYIGAVCIGMCGVGFNDCTFGNVSASATVITDVPGLDFSGANAAIPEATISQAATASLGIGEGAELGGTAAGPPCMDGLTDVYAELCLKQCIVSHSVLLGGLQLQRCAAEWNGCVLVKTPPPTITLTCPPLTSGVVGVAYSSSLTASGGTPPYTYSIVLGSLPPGLTLNASTGAITGTPTTAGIYTFTALVVDSLGFPATVTCTITIVTVSLVCPSLVSGVVGTFYSSSLVVTGGTPPFTFTITAGSLPPGLTLNSSNGLISGTPTTAGVYSFTVLVTDSHAATASVSCTITITSAAPPPPPVPLAVDCQAIFYKTPGDVLDFVFDWSAWLAGDAVISSSWAITSGDASLSIQNSTFTSTSATVWLAGGLDGQTYIVTNTVATQLGRREVRSFQLTLWLCHTSPPDPPARAATECFRVAVENPNQSIDVQITWSDWLRSGDAIRSSTWTVDAGLSVAGSSFSRTSTAARITGSGAVAGSSYRAVNTVVTQQGRTEVRRVLFDMRVCS